MNDGSLFKGLAVAIPVGIAMWVGIFYAVKWALT